MPFDSDELDQIFNFNPWPAHIYESICDAINANAIEPNNGWEDLANLNGRYHMLTFKPFYSSYEDAAMQVAKFHEESFSDFYRLKTLGKSASSLIGPIAAACNDMDAMAIHDALLFMNANQGWDHSLTRQHYVLNTLMQSNTSQYHRDVQKRMAEEYLPWIRRLLVGLNHQCEIRGKVWSLRPFLNLPSSHQQTLNNVTQMTGIPMPTMYYSESMLATQSLFEKWELDFFPPIARVAADVGPLARFNHTMWKWWNKRAAYAVAFDAPSYRSEIAVAPNGLIPPLYIEPSETLPVFSALRLPFGALYESVYTVAHMARDDWDSSGVPPASVEPRWDDVIFANSLGLACFSATLIAAGIRLGKGHHKPRWMRTPLNAATLRYYGEFLVHTVEELERL